MENKAILPPSTISISSSTWNNEEQERFWQCGRLIDKTIRKGFWSRDTLLAHLQNIIRVIIAELPSKMLRSLARGDRELQLLELTMSPYTISRNHTYSTSSPLSTLGNYALPNLRKAPLPHALFLLSPWCLKTFEKGGRSPRKDDGKAVLWSSRLYFCLFHWTLGSEALIILKSWIAYGGDAANGSLVVVQTVSTVGEVYEFPVW